MILFCLSDAEISGSRRPFDFWTLQQENDWINVSVNSGHCRSHKSHRAKPERKSLSDGIRSKVDSSARITHQDPGMESPRFKSQSYDSGGQNHHAFLVHFRSNCATGSIMNGWSQKNELREEDDHSAQLDRWNRIFFGDLASDGCLTKKSDGIFPGQSLISYV
jgi:hypothetical protein